VAAKYWKSKEMIRSYAQNILTWSYEPPYDLYNNDDSEESMNELLNGSYVAVVNENDQLVGFYCTGVSSHVPAGNKYGAYDIPMLDVGIGLRPELTGQGNGASFFSWVLETIQKSGEPIRLTVGTFNTRAIKLYEKLGFKKHLEFEANGNGFQTMIKKNHNSYF
jgi:[ribosomal protein S18]-alanine N-acetyltransferase